MNVMHEMKEKIRTYLPFAESLYMPWKGRKILDQIRRKYGKETHIFVMRGATGDTYIQLAMVHNWLREHAADRYAMIGDSAGGIELAEMFGENNYEYIEGYDVNCIEKAYMLWGKDELDITILFPWTYTLYFNRCRIRMTERFHFMDTYRYYVFDLKEIPQLRTPYFTTLTENEIEELHQLGVVQGKTVVIAPEANSVTELEMEVWDQIINILKQKGYAVLINSKEKKYQAPNYFSSYAKSVPLLEYAGYFLGLRSGFCDITVTAKCRRVIIYPAKAKQTDYGDHRTEIEFCGLKRMGLIREDDTTLTEIETRLVRNITQKYNEITSQTEYDLEERQLLEQITACF